MNQPRAFADPGQSVQGMAQTWGLHLCQAGHLKFGDFQAQMRLATQGADGKER